MSSCSFFLSIKIFLLICHEISWLYIFQSTFPTTSPNPSKRFHQSLQCNKRCRIIVLSTFSFWKQCNPNDFNGHIFLSNKEKHFQVSETRFWNICINFKLKSAFCGVLKREQFELTTCWQTRFCGGEGRAEREHEGCTAPLAPKR